MEYDNSITGKKKKKVEELDVRDAANNGSQLRSDFNYVKK